MSKNVCMFVWNHFTNDARVLRECTSLSENGYKVRLVCIDDPNDKSLSRHEWRNNNFEIVRVRRFPIGLEMMSKGYRTLKKHKWLLGLGMLSWILLMYQYLLSTIIVSSVLLVLLMLMAASKVRTVWIRSNIFFRMIMAGSSKKFDMYHSNDLNTLIQGYICSKWRLKKKPLIYDSHEVQTSRTGYNSPLYGKLEKNLLKKVDRMMVENHTRAAYNEKLYGFYPKVLHNYPFTYQSNDTTGIDLHEQLQLSPNEKILLYQGGIQIGRGLEKLIEAVPHFDEGTLVFIGDGRQKPELLQMVRERKLENRVKFIDKVPLADLPKYTKNAYLGFQVLNNICYNHWSASSNKLFEYMMSNVPIVACSFPEIQRVVMTENIGVCVDSHDSVDIARGVNELLRDPQLRQQMSQNCDKAKLIYNWNNEQQALLDVYEEIS